MALMQGLVFWPVGTAVAHAAFVFVLGRLLAELLTPQNRQAAVRLHLLPGQLANLRALAVVLRAVLLLHRRLRENRSGAVAAGRASSPGSAWSRRSPRRWSCCIRRRAVSALPALRFDEEDTAALFQGFHLSEGLAAAPRPLVRESASLQSAGLPAVARSADVGLPAARSADVGLPAVARSAASLVRP